VALRLTSQLPVLLDTLGAWLYDGLMSTRHVAHKGLLILTILAAGALLLITAKTTIAQEYSTNPFGAPSTTDQRWSYDWVDTYPQERSLRRFAEDAVRQYFRDNPDPRCS
jgi:hypothetical protein